MKNIDIKSISITMSMTLDSTVDFILIKKDDIFLFDFDLIKKNGIIHCIFVNCIYSIDKSSSLRSNESQSRISFEDARFEIRFCYICISNQS